MTTKIALPPLPDDAINKDRPVSGLLKAQVLQLYEAERRLLPRYRTKFYINAIKMEGEAAEYICAVTEGIHDAHKAALEKRERSGLKGVIEIAAATNDRLREDEKMPDDSKPVEFSGHAIQQM
jgi:hypothetical protein